MLTHYLRSAVRSLLKAPVATLANGATLALGLLAFVTAYAVVAFWGSAERQFRNAERTYVVASRIERADGTRVLAKTPIANRYVASYLLTDYPQIQATARAWRVGDRVPVAAGEATALVNAVAVDPAFTTVFDLPFRTGDARSALSAPASAVLTEETARRLFGATNAIGKAIVISGRADVTVTGVVAAVTEPSHMGRSASASLRFDLLVSADVLERIRGGAPAAAENWFAGDSTTYVLFPEDGSITPRQLSADLENFVARHSPAQQRAFGTLDLDLVPVTGMLALDASGLVFGVGEHSATLWVLIMGALVLAAACVNYASFAAARAASRAHEIGVRKAIGATRAQIMRQHLIEAAVLIAVTLIIAVIGLRFAAPTLLADVGIDVTLTFFSGVSFWVFLILLIAGVTLAAGAYPAFVLARMPPLAALRGSRVRAGRRLITGLLVLAQFAVSGFLLVVVAVIYFQNEALVRVALGLEEGPLIVLENRSDMTGVAPDTLREALLDIPQVRGVTAVRGGLSGGNALVLARTAEASSPVTNAGEQSVSYDFAETLGFRLLAGRTFERARAEDTVDFRQGQQNIVVDRALAEDLGFASPAEAVGEVVFLPASFMAIFGTASPVPLLIVGVVDSKQLGMYGSGSGTFYRFGSGISSNVIRVSSDDVGGAVAAIDRVWARLAPAFAPDRRFADELFAEQYASFARISAAVAILAAFGLAIATIGLFAFASVVAARRLRELGVRKTIGASDVQLALLLVRGFLLPIVLGNVIAWPIALAVARGYLERFADPVAITPLPFGVCLVVTLVAAACAVGGQTLRAARCVPADVLRAE